jgi:hypothetical protein
MFLLVICGYSTKFDIGDIGNHKTVCFTCEQLVVI